MSQTDSHLRDSHLRVVPEAQMPLAHRRGPARSRSRWVYQFQFARDLVRLAMFGFTAFIVVFIYIGVPIALLAGDRLDSLLHAALLAAAAVASGAAIVLAVLHSTNLDVEEDDLMEPLVGGADVDGLTSARPQGLRRDRGPM